MFIIGFSYGDCSTGLAVYDGGYSGMVCFIRILVGIVVLNDLLVVVFVVGTFNRVVVFEEGFVLGGDMRV